MITHLDANPRTDISRPFTDHISRLALHFRIAQPQNLAAHPRISAYSLFHKHSAASRIHRIAQHNFTSTLFPVRIQHETCRISSFFLFLSNLLFNTGLPRHHSALAWTPTRHTLACPFPPGPKRGTSTSRNATSSKSTQPVGCGAVARGARQG